MPQLRVLVVGASIAGTSAAYWFRKAGALVTVIERFPSFRLTGQNVDIRTVGVKVMRKMPGMEATVRASTTTMNSISFVDARGRSYGAIAATGDPEQQSLVSEYEIFRGELADIIYRYTKDDEDVRYVFGEQLAGMTPQGDDGESGPVVVEFANGRAAEEFDLVVACDGAASRTRALGLGCGFRDYVVTTNHWAAYFDIEKDLLEGGKVGLSYSAPGGRMICLGPGPDGGSKGVLFSVAASSTPDLTGPFRAAQQRGDAALREFVADRCRGAGWRTDEILDHMMASNAFYASEMVRVKTETLSRGSYFALVGDAGYASASGTGTTLAMAGAYVLAGEVARHPGDVRAALAAYETAMRPLVDDMQKVSPLFWSVMAPQTAWGIALRNRIFQFVCWTRVLDLAQKFFAGAFSSAEKHVLPEYEWVN